MHFFDETITVATEMRETEFVDPYQAFLQFRNRPHAAFLDSSLDVSGLGRYSYVAFDPFLMFHSKGRRVTIAHNGATVEIEENPFRVLKRLFAIFTGAAEKSSVPFSGGALGYFSYDVGRLIEKLPDETVDDIDLPDIYLPFYRTVFAFDNAEKRAFLVTNTFTPDSLFGKAPDHAALLKELKQAPAAALTEDGALASELESNFSEEAYRAGVRNVLDYIAAGDIFQANLSQRFHATWRGSHIRLYDRLRKINPAPFSAFLSLGGGASVVSSSPERFVKREGSFVETVPMKGTRPRGADGEEDAVLKDELIGSEKERAELTMITDLERNDLGRVSAYGSVRVENARLVQDFPTVFHTVSVVRGELLDRFDNIDIVKAMSPGGSITGAPKIRAMEIIEELEPTKRSVYTGTIGYLGFNTNMQLNIAIRTLIAKGSDIYFQVGGGIVADSTPQGEYDETLHKAKALIMALKSEVPAT